MASLPERIMKLEGVTERMRNDLDEVMLLQRTQEKALVNIATDKARVVTGAWVANGLTCVFVAIILVLANRLAAAEVKQFKDDVIREVRAANANAMQGPAVRR